MAVFIPVVVEHADESMGAEWLGFDGGVLKVKLDN